MRGGILRGEGEIQIGRPAMGGRAKLDDPLRGASEIGRPIRGANIFGLDQYFFKSLKPDFFNVLGTFNFGVQGGGRTKLDVSLGGGANEIGPLIFLDSLRAK